VEVRTLAAVPPVNIAKRPARSAGPALLRRDGVGSFQPGTLLGQLEVAGAREPSWEHPAAPLGASRAQKEHESPFPGWCWCPPPRLYETCGFLASRVMPLIQVKDDFSVEAAF